MIRDKLGHRLSRRSWFRTAAWLVLLATWAVASAETLAGPVFEPAASPLATNGRYTATADLDHDGHLDLAGVLNTTDEVSILLGAGDGTFPTELRFPVGDQPFATAAADFNEDGHLDLVVSNLDDISILLGNGNGSFQPETRLAIAQFRIGREPAVGDLNDDGHVDIVVPQRLFGLITILLGHGDGTFEPPSQFPTQFSSRHRTVVIGDLNEDNLPDLVLGNEGCCSLFEVFLGDGDGGFDPPQAVETLPGAIPISLALADLDVDGHLDVVVANLGFSPPKGVSVSLGHGDGTFGPFSHEKTDRDALAVAVADFDQDGRVDVAVVEQDQTTGWSGLSVLLGNGDGTLVFKEEFELGSWDFILVGDFNEDSLPDLIASPDVFPLPDAPRLFLNLGPRNFPPGFVDDSDREDSCFGVDDPPVCDATDIEFVETHASLCDFACAGGPDLCCGPGSGGEEALIVHMEVIGAGSLPTLSQGEFNVFVDFGEAVDLDGDGTPDLSLGEATSEPGVTPVDTSDIRIRADMAQSSSPNKGGRFGVSPHFSANAGLNPRVGLLSRVDQAAGAVDFVVPLAEILAAADETQKAAAGIEADAERVDFLLWWSSRCQGNVVDRAPNTDDQGPPSVRFEASPFSTFWRQLALLNPNRTTKPVDFRGSDRCGGGNGDLVIVGTQSPPQTLTLRNPSFAPLTVSGLSFSDPSFSTTATFPVVVPGLGGEVSVPVIFQPVVEGSVVATVTAVGDDPTPPSLSLLGDGFPDEPPILGVCSAGTGTVVTGEPFVISVEASDSAGLANIAACSATAQRAGGAGTISFPLTDDGLDVSDVACDGSYVHTQLSGTLLGPGSWVFETECTDRQGNMTSGIPCSLQVQQDLDGDGIPDIEDPCPLDPLNDADGDGLCAGEDNCPLVRNNGAPSNGFSGGTADTCLDPGVPHCLRIDFLGFPDVPLCVDIAGNNDLTPCTSDADCTVTAGFDTCAEVAAVVCVDRLIAVPLSTCRLGPAAQDIFGVGFPNFDANNVDCLANEPPGCVSDADGRLISLGCSVGDGCGTDIQTDTDGNGIGDACEP